MLQDRLLVARSRVRALVIVAILYALSLAIFGPALQFSQWTIDPAWNPPADEALSWLQGRLDLSTRGLDIAVYEGRFYNIFPPLWTFVCLGVYGFNTLVYGEPLVFLTPLYYTILAVPVPILIYLAFRRGGASTKWALLLALYAMGGTCLWPEAASCRRGWIYGIQHVLSQIGMAILLIDLFGRRRYWLGGIGAMIAAWSRQLCVLYALPLVWEAWKEPNRKAAILKVLTPILVAVGVQMGLNWAKFGSPLENGYEYIFHEREGGEVIKVKRPDGHIDVFARRFMPSNAYHLWVQPPWFDFTHQGLSLSGHGAGTAVWYGSPLLLLAAWDARRWWRDRIRRGLMLASVPVILALLAYHGPGYGTPGYYRYSLDFVLVWLVVIAPWTRGGGRRTFTLLCFAWSLAYYYLVTVAR